MVGEANRWPGFRGRPDRLACAFCFLFAGREPGSHQSVRKAVVGVWRRNPRASQDETHQ